jgi:hypothetical protein
MVSSLEAFLAPIYEVEARGEPVVRCGRGEVQAVMAALHGQEYQLRYLDANGVQYAKVTVHEDGSMEAPSLDSVGRW